MPTTGMDQGVPAPEDTSTPPPQHVEGGGILDFKMDSLKTVRYFWGIYIHSEEFRAISHDAFYRSCDLKDGLEGHDDDELDPAELQFAMDLMHEQLNAKAFGKLPKPLDNARHLLAQFDVNGNGRLDLEEFYRFSLIYFSELQWPIWKVATKGAMMGIGSFVLCKHAVIPLLFKAVRAAAPTVVGFFRRVANRRLRRSFQRMRIGWSEGGLWPVSERERTLLSKKEREQRIKKRVGYCKGMAIGVVVGSSAAVAGLI